MMNNSKLFLLVFVLLILNSALALAYFYPPTTGTAEIVGMKRAQSTNEKVSLYRKLIERVGPQQAQEDLFRSGLPFTGETHLINHLSGDYLYKKYGVAGILYCKDYFLSSCYHGLLLNAIANEGSESLSTGMDICYEKGPTVSSQCAHAIGHGLLAWVGYKKLTLALEHCEALHKEDTRFPTFNCEDGVFMENLWAVHDDGAPSPDRWIKTEDPLYPCSDPRIKPEWQSACWSNQPSVMYQNFKGDIEKTAKWCSRAPKEHRAMCLNGLARQIHPLTEGRVDKTFALCSLLPETERPSCAITIAIADYSVGGRITSFEICKELVSSSQERCYKSLYGIMHAYQGGQPAKETCAPLLSKNRVKECLAALAP